MTKCLIRRPGPRSRLLLNAILAGAVLILLPGAAAAQRGASGPPEHAAVEPIKHVDEAAVDQSKGTRT